MLQSSPTIGPPVSFIAEHMPHSWDSIREKKGARGELGFPIYGLHRHYSVPVHNRLDPAQSSL